MYRHRSNYWSCSNFASWVRGTGKPTAASPKDWKAWEQICRENRPLRYWLAEEFLDILQNIVYFPYDVYHEIRSYINNRYVHKTHALTSNLKRGQYHELDDRLLHCMFDELVNFVEIEKAHMQRWLDDTGKWKKIPRRCPEAGIEYLTWEANLTFGSDGYMVPDDESYGKPTLQAEYAKKILELYNWWKEIRPQRRDPYEESGWTDYCNHNPDFIGRDKRKQSKILLDKLNKLEKEQDDEDERMMIELIKIRKSLWT